MPKPALRRDEVRDVDRRAVEDYGLPGIVLMENAGRGAAELLIRLGIAGPVLICAGKGNNGGDGFVIARHLDLAGYEPRVLLFCDPAGLTGDAAINYRVLKSAGMAGSVMGENPDDAAVRQDLATADWIVDALLGTGARGTLREPYLSTIAAINRSGKKVLAVDLPSGMDCDTGLGLDDGAGGRRCVQATHTATFVAAKWGFLQPGAERLTGAVHVIGIGAPRRLVEDVLREGG